MMCLLHVLASNYACRMYKDINPFGFRIPAGLREKAESAAKANDRSLNAELVARVRESFESRNELKDFSDGELIDELIRRWGRDRVQIKLGDEKP